MNFPRLDSYKVIAIDTEGTGVKWYKDETIGFALSTEDRDYYWDIRETPKALDWLYDTMKSYNGKIINHAMKFDVHMLRQLGVDIVNKDIDCTMVRAQLIDEHLFEYSLDSIAKKYLGTEKVDPYKELAEIFGGKATRKAQIGNLWRAPVELVAPYAKKDTRLALDLWHWQEKEKEKQKLYRIFKLEKDLLPVLIRMEARGIRIDIAKAEQNLEETAKLIKSTQRKINSIIGREFNINSTPQIRKLFKPKRIEGTKQFRLIDGTICSATAASIRNEKNGTGELAPSIGKDVLKQMSHPMANMIINLRTMIKIHGTFLRDQILGYQQNGYIYPNFKQCGTVNGRFSASGPALQAIPKRNKEMSRLTRSVFLPDDGEEMLRCDFEQSDFRGFVHYTGSAPLVAAYENDPWTDFHGLIAELLTIPRSPQSGGGANAKQINLGSIFGMGVGKLAKTMGLPYTEEVSRQGKVWLKPGPEAEEVFCIYHENIPGVANFNKRASGVARSRGYIKSIMGRHMRFPNKNLTYKAPGYLYSSFTSDLCKLAMIATDELAKIKLQVHDEIIFSIPDRKIIPEVQEAMQTVFGDLTTVPIRTNPQVGPNWFECKEIKNEM